VLAEILTSRKDENHNFILNTVNTKVLTKQLPKVKVSGKTVEKKPIVRTQYIFIYCILLCRSKSTSRQNQQPWFTLAPFERYGHLMAENHSFSPPLPLNAFTRVNPLKFLDEISGKKPGSWEYPSARIL